jgi:RNA polymerase sigma-70 factor (ECF subfamily)
MNLDERAGIQTLLTRLAAGDRAAIEPAFAALRPVLRRFSARALPIEADAEDAAQQALVRIFEQSAGFDPARDGVAWALTIASFECRTIRRRAQRRREQALDADDGAAPPTDTPEALVLERDLAAAAREALAGLAEGDVQAILASLEEGRPAGATFRKRLQRALGRLRVAWRAKHET